MQGHRGDPPLTVVLVDDHPLFREGLREVLEGQGFEVVARERRRGLDLTGRH